MELLITYSIPASVLLRIVSSIILAFLLIPLQIKESHVKNELRVLRFQLLSVGVILLLTNLLTLIGLIIAFDVPQQPVNAVLQTTNASTFLILAIIMQSIYLSQYTQKSTDYHSYVEERDTKADKRAKAVLKTAKIKAKNLLKNPKS